MNFSKVDLEGVVVVDLRYFEDHRGVYVETYNKDAHSAQGFPDFVQDDYSISRRHVLRGLHGDHETWKLITCPIGEIYFVVLDNRQESPTFGNWRSFVISEHNHRQVLVPPGFANGHLVLSERAMFHYKQTTYYSKNQFTIRWDDSRFNIWWPVKTPILSRRDEAGQYLD